MKTCSLDEIIANLSKDGPLLAVTPDPVRQNFRSLGLSELWAGIGSSISTTLASLLFSHPLALSLVGPLCEKPMFFGRHFREAYMAHKEHIRQNGTKTFTDFLKPEMKEAMRDLWMDLAFHDTAYVGLTNTFLTHGMHPSIASAAAFSAGIPFAAVLQAGLEHGLHQTLKQASKLAGVKWENYHEARFLYDGDASELQNGLQNRYGLKEVLTGEYRDVYLENRLLKLANRSVKARHRVITGDFAKNCVEMVFTTDTRKSFENKLYNYFITTKQKGSFPVQGTEWHKQLPYMLRGSISDTPESNIDFSRRTCHDNELSVCADTISDKLAVVEVKVFSDIDKLVDAITYLHDKYKIDKIVQTTKPKADMFGALASI